MGMFMHGGTLGEAAASLMEGAELRAFLEAGATGKVEQFIERAEKEIEDAKGKAKDAQTSVALAALFNMGCVIIGLAAPFHALSIAALLANVANMLLVLVPKAEERDAQLRRMEDMKAKVASARSRLPSGKARERLTDLMEQIDRKMDQAVWLKG